MNTLPFPDDINLISYLPLLESKKLKTLSHDSLKYIYHNNLNVKINAANIIKNFFKYSHNLFQCGQKLNGELLYKFKDKNSKIFKRIKFTTVNLLYFYEYDNKMADSFIKGLHVDYKSDIIKKYFDFDENKTYSKYDLNKLITLMDFNDIFIVGF